MVQYLSKQDDVGAGFNDQDYQQAGAQIVYAGDAWNREVVVKVKEPLLQYRFLQKGQLLFTYLHLAADRRLTEF